MKTIVFLFNITFIFLFMGCTHVQVEEAPRTIVSDLFPEQITRTEYYRQLAWGYDRDGKLPEAIELYRLALMHDPKNILAKIQLSDVFRKEKIDHLASAQLTEVLKLQPHHILVLKKLGDLYLQNHIYSKALTVYQKLVRLDTADEKSMWAIYFIYKLEKQYTLALEQLDNIKNSVQVNAPANTLNSPRTLVLVSAEKAAIHRLRKDWVQEQKYLIAANQLQPNEYAHVNLLADSYFRFKNWTDAAALLGRFTDTNDYSFEISEKLAFASIQIQNYEIALREYDKQKPWHYDSYVLDMKIAHTYFLMKDYTTAEKKYLLLLQQRDEEEVKYYLSKIYQITDRISESIALLEELPPASEYYGEAQIELADFENKKGLFNEAINRMRKVHNKRPDLLVVYKRYGDLMIENKRYVETIALLEQGIGFYPEDEELRYKLAFLHYHMNNQRAFKKQLNKAMQINPNNSEIYVGLAELLYVKGKTAADVEYFIRKAINLKSKNKNLQPLMAWALIEQNKSAQALAVFEEYYEQNPKEYFYVKSLADIYRLSHITSKADSFGKVAKVLEVDSKLKEKLLEKILHPADFLDPLQKNNTRMPASLENF